MKPFNLEEAKAGKPVVTRDGKPTRIICFNKIDTDGYPIIALIYGENGIERVKSYDQNGHNIKGSENKSDLFMAPIKREGWVNLYKTEDGAHVGNTVRATREESYNNRDRFSANYVTTVKIEWEE